jgi:hypothetical protein
MYQTTEHENKIDWKNEQKSHPNVATDENVPFYSTNITKLLDLVYEYYQLQSGWRTRGCREIEITAKKDQVSALSKRIMNMLEEKTNEQELIQFLLDRDPWNNVPGNDCYHEFYIEYSRENLIISIQESHNL